MGCLLLRLRPAPPHRQEDTNLVHHARRQSGELRVPIQDMVLEERLGKQEILTQETVELLTSPLELAEYKSAIMEAMFKGTKRNVESENNSKNAPVG